MKSNAFILTLAALAVAAGAGFALDRAAFARVSRADREEVQRQLDKVQALAAQHRKAFGAGAVISARPEGLKTLAQETAAQRQVTIAHLSESDREADKGGRERQVMVRLTNVLHANLVFFLQDLEARGGGAKVKEIHLRPSRELPDAYDESEIILSRVFQEAKP